MRTSTLTAILWHQGESDCLAPEQLEAYPEQFLRTMRAFRAELGDLPIVVGELGYPENGFHGTPAELLKEFNRRLPELAAQLPHCAVVSAAGLPPARTACTLPPRACGRWDCGIWTHTRV